MKWAYHIKYKIRTVCFLAGLLVVILAGNLYDQQSVSSLDHSMSSIFNDRLKPSVYLYGISGRLYEKRMLLSGQLVSPENEAMQQHDEAIAGMIGKYEGTVLTKEEKEQWLLFKAQLLRYNAIEQEVLAARQQGNDLAPAALDQELKRTLGYLDNLSKIQVGEGSSLVRDSQSVVNCTQIVSQLEIALLIILGLFTLALLSVSDKRLFRQSRQQLWN